MRIKSLESEVLRLLGKNLDLRLYGTKEGIMSIEVWIGARWWRGKHITTFYLDQERVTPAKIAEAIAATIKDK